MNAFNLGSGEFFLLIVLAILLVGPRRAVEWTQELSRFAARLRQEWLAAQRDLMLEIQALQKETANNLQPTFQEAIQEGQVLRSEVAEAERALRDVSQRIRKFQKQVVCSPSPSLPPLVEPTDDLPTWSPDEKTGPGAATIFSGAL